MRAAFEAAVERQLVSDVPLGSYLSGGMDSASIVAVASASIPRLMTFTGGFDLSVRGTASSSSLTSGPTPKPWRALQHPALRDGDARRRHGLGAARARLAPRGSTRRDVATRTTTSPARLEVRQGRARRSRRRRAVCRLSVALRPGERAGRPEEFDRAYYGYWYRLVPGDEQGASSPATCSGGRATARRSSSTGRRCSRRRTSTRSRRRSTSRRRPSSTGCSSSRTSVSMAHSLEVRVPFLDNDLVALAEKIPAGSSTATAEARSCSARRWRRCSPRRSSRSASRASAHPTSPGTAAPPWLTSARSCSTAEPRPRLLRAGVRQARTGGAPPGPRQPPAPDLVAAVLRVVEPALHGRRRRDRAGGPFDERARYVSSTLDSVVWCPACRGGKPVRERRCLRLSGV